jgi:hypothetical protein
LQCGDLSTLSWVFFKPMRDVKLCLKAVSLRSSAAQKAATSRRTPKGLA